METYSVSKKELKKLNEMYIPNKEKTKEALGDVKKELRNERIRMVFEQDVVDTFYDRMVIEDPGEWIPATQQDSQNFDGYKYCGFNELYQDRCTIYIQPLDSSVDDSLLQKCLTFCEAYYHGLPVKVRKHKDIKKLKIDSRMNCGKKQYNARGILREAKRWIPEDAYCMICVTNYDLYPKDDWNFVFGLASLRDRTGVFSFARYDPAFFDENDENAGDTEMVVYRSIRVMTHEIGHMFGIQHCVYYQCNMNGSMSAEESSKRPGHLCPICLRKLWYNIGFDPLERYKAIAEACDTVENKYFDKEKEWYLSIIEHIENKYKNAISKCDKPFKKRYPKNDPNKPVKKVSLVTSKPASKKTGIERLKEKRTKEKASK